MDAGRIFQQLFNMIFRRAMNTAINKGIDHVARKGRPPGQMTAEERKQANAARDMTKKARQAAKIARRLGR